MDREERNIGCFQWCVSVKKAFNERWARARNRLIRLVRRRDATVHTADIVNDTGTPDLVFEKRHVAPIIDMVDIVEAASRHSIHDLERDVAELDKVDHADPELVMASPRHSVSDLAIKAFAATYVQSIVSAAQAKLQCSDRPVSPVSTTSSALSEFAENFSRTILVSEQIKLDAETRRTSPESITSSQAEDIADLAVQDSLTRIANTNESATRRPKTAREVIEALGLGSFEKDGSMPRVDMNLFRKK